MLKSILLGIASTVLSCAGVAQTTTSPAFEVASVKPSGPDSDRGPMGSGGWGAVTSDGGVRFSYTELGTVFANAYRVDLRYRVVPGPYSEIFSSRFDIEAKGGEGSVPDKLKALLAERFQLRTHTELRERPIYALTVKTPGQLGPGLTPSSFNCSELLTTGVARSDAPAACRTSGEFRYGAPLQRFAGTMADLLRLTESLDQPAVDQTGLRGNFEWAVAFDASRRRKADVPNIFTAFEDQLGLKLTPTRGPYEVLVIDHVQPPSPN